MLHAGALISELIAPILCFGVEKWKTFTYFVYFCSNFRFIFFPFFIFVLLTVCFFFAALCTQIFKELLLQAKLAYKLSPSLRKNSRRQSLPPIQGGSSSSMHNQPGSCPPSTVHVPSPLQLQHLQQIQARNTRGKRNSCILS